MIELQNVQIKYGDFTAVENLSLKIEDGEFFTFLGPSGCGKTTTLRAIAGFEQPTNGSIFAYNKDLGGLLPEERGLGFVFQNYALFPAMNVYENIAFGLKAHRVSKNEIAERVADIAEKTDITEHLNKKISELSGGQQQRIAIARALVLKPKILLMDEPLSNLDAKLRVSTREEIRALQRKFGITTIYVTHDQEEAMAISDRIAVFNVGKVEQVGTPKQIYNTPNNSFVARFIGDINCFEGQTEQELKALLSSKKEEKLFARPHKLNTHKSVTKQDNHFYVNAVIESYEYLGSYTVTVAKTKDDFKLTSLSFGSETEFSIGEEVSVSVCLDDVLALQSE